MTPDGLRTAQRLLDEHVVARMTYPRDEYVAILRMLIAVVDRERRAAAIAAGWSRETLFPY